MGARKERWDWKCVCQLYQPKHTTHRNYYCMMYTVYLGCYYEIFIFFENESRWAGMIKLHSPLHSISMTQQRNSEAHVRVRKGSCRWAGSALIPRPSGHPWTRKPMLDRHIVVGGTKTETSRRFIENQTKPTSEASFGIT